MHSPMDKQTKHQLAELVNSTECTRDFACVKSGFESECEARDIGLDHNLICLDKQACQECGFGHSVGIAHFCRCPVRVYAAKALGK